MISSKVPDDGAKDNPVAFLKAYQPDGPWCLTAIHPDKKGTMTKTFTPATEADMRSWLAYHEGRFNLYFHVNRVNGLLLKKAEREQIKWVDFLHVDIDPVKGKDLDAEQSRILALFESRKLADLGVGPPTFLIFSGGGYQAFWRLDLSFPMDGTPAMAEEVARYNRQLEKIFGGDRCHNIDRLMRLPFTMNLPDERKRAAGRVPVMSHVVTAQPDRSYPIEIFQKAKVDAPKAATKPVSQISDLNQLDVWKVPDDIKLIIAEGHDPDRPKAKDNSRSAWVWHVLMALARHDVPANVMLSIITDPTWKISASILERGRGAAKDAARQIEKAKLKAIEFQYNEEGDLYNSRHNWMVALNEMKVELSRNIFEDMTELSGLPGFDGRLSDDAEIELRVLIEKNWSALRPGKDAFHDTLVYLGNRDRYHPVCDYLDGLKWDGVARIDTWLTDYAGAETTELTRAIGALWLTAAVRRVRSPGCKFDEMLVFEQGEGTMKSTAMNVLAGDWFSDSLPLGADAKETIEQTNGKWIIEIAELQGLKSGSRNVHVIKAFLSRTQETARMAYGRNAATVPRQFVCVGTTNHSEYLSDPTGNRRFWPVKVERFDIERLRADRDQIWAEAAAREAAGASIRLDPSLWQAAAVAQTERRVNDPWVEAIEAVLPKGEIRVFTADLWSLLGVSIDRRSQGDNIRLANVMKQLGFEKGKDARRDGGNPRNNYVRGQGPRWANVEIEGRIDANRNWTPAAVIPPGYGDYAD